MEVSEMCQCGRRPALLVYHVDYKKGDGLMQVLLNTDPQSQIQQKKCTQIQRA